MKILVINGPNINMLGTREPELYGTKSYRDLLILCENTCKELGATCISFQSNHEGAIVDVIQQAAQDGIDGIVINAAAYSHTSIAILDALKAVKIRTVEVHITDPKTREEFRHLDYIAMASEKTIAGHGIEGYKEAIEYLVKGQIMDVRIEPGKYWGKVTLPSSKSEMHRKIILGTLGHAGRINGSDECDDTKTTFDVSYALQRTYQEGKEPEIRKCDCGSSAASLRMLLPIAGLIGKKYLFEGSEQLSKRPIKELLDVLRTHGMTIEGDSLPLIVSGKLEPGAYEISCDVSSQYVSGLLMALPMLGGDSTLKIVGDIESKGYIDITLECLKSFEIEIGGEFGNWQIKGGQSPVLPEIPKRAYEYANPNYKHKFKKHQNPPSPGSGIKCELDWSIAANYIVANYLGSDVQIDGLNENSLQPDRAIVEDLKLLGGSIDISQTPDLAPILAVAACGYKGDTVLIGCKRLKYKESDRIESTVDMINALGGNAEAGEDSITIHGTGKLSGGKVDPKGDHRIVMAATMAAQICESSVSIFGAECVSKSCLNFFMDATWLGAQMYYNV